jgi:hypothetical protein
MNGQRLLIRTRSFLQDSEGRIQIGEKARRKRILDLPNPAWQTITCTRYRSIGGVKLTLSTGYSDALPGTTSYENP